MSRPRLRKVALLLVGSVFALLVAAIVGVNIYQRFKRHQAEKLLAEISNLELRHATFDDARRIVAEWKRYATLKPGCNRERCEIEITLVDYRWYPHYESLFWTLGPLVLRTGARPLQINARVAVRDGLVWGKGFDAGIWVRNLENTGFGPYMLMAEASSLSHFDVFGTSDPQLRLHPNYVIGKPAGCSGCLFAYTHFTPYADPAYGKRLMQINLSCMTSWRPCQTEADILPNAWVQWERELPVVRSAYDHYHCSPVDREILGRDSMFAAVVEITAVRAHRIYDQMVQARMIRPLKPAVFSPKAAEIRFGVNQGDVAEPQVKLRKGLRIILLSGQLPVFDPNPGIQVTQCGIYPLNEANLDQVEKGVEQDYGARDGVNLQAGP